MDRRLWIERQVSTKFDRLTSESSLSDVLLVCPSAHKEALGQYFNSEDYSYTLNVKIEVYETDDPTSGTMEALSKIASKCQVCTSRCQRSIILMFAIGGLRDFTL
jgi:hypothetical protein